MHRSTHDRKARRRYPRTALLVAGGFAVAALIWMVVGVPTLVKYPTDLEASPQYEGTFTLLVDPSTAAPLAEPIDMPLSIDREIEVIGEETGASRALVRETLSMTAGDIEMAQNHDYVMDRSSLENVADDRAFAFDPANEVDRSGAYRLNLPFDTSRDDTYDMYKNEIDGTYEMVVDADPPTTELEGLDLSNFTGSIDEVPVSDAYLAELNEVVPLPDEMTLEQLEPHLLAAGIDVDAVMAALTPVLTPEDAATLGEFAAEPIPLEYDYSFDGGAAVEPVTGAEIRVYSSESVGARPELTSLPALQEVLSHYPDVPEAAATSAALDDLAQGPAIPLFEYDYAQTPASVADIADTAGALRSDVLLAKVWLPLGLAGAAVASLIVGGIVYLWRRPRPIETTGRDEPHPPPRPDKEERELADQRREFVTTGRKPR